MERCNITRSLNKIKKMIIRFVPLKNRKVQIGNKSDTCVKMVKKKTEINRSYFENKMLFEYDSNTINI